MPIVQIQWWWEEAFNKFGFGDGDGYNATDEVRRIIELEGYDVDCTSFGIHNYGIRRVSKGEDAWTFSGYQDPRRTLPPSLVQALDAAFPNDGAYEGFEE